MTSEQVQTSPDNQGAKVRNFLIAIAAIILSVALLIGLRTQTTSATLESLSKGSTPLEVALNNGKPSLIEFYADWCTVCQKMAPEVGALEESYADKINFVMLNVDNSKWLPEMTQYQVDGIPHFVYVNSQGEAVAQAIGNTPRAIMAENIDALVAGNNLPYAQASGATSAFKPPVTPNSNQNSDPRLHGSQVRS